MQSRLGDAALESKEVGYLLAASGGGLEKLRETEEAEQQHKVESTEVKVFAKFVRLLTPIRQLNFPPAG